MMCLVTRRTRIGLPWWQRIFSPVSFTGLTGGLRPRVRATPETLRPLRFQHTTGRTTFRQLLCSNLQDFAVPPQSDDESEKVSSSPEIGTCYRCSRYAADGSTSPRRGHRIPWLPTPRAGSPPVRARPDHGSTAPSRTREPGRSGSPRRAKARYKSFHVSLAPPPGSRD